MSTPASSRREFLSTTLAGAAAMSLTRMGRADDVRARIARMPTRPFANSGERVSLLCVGGHHLARGGVAEEEAIRIIHEAMDHGATFMDNAWEYHNGVSEERMGKALRGPRRNQAFLMTKTMGRDARTATKELEASLRRLRTDRIDLWQFHNIRADDEPDRIFAPGGAVEVAEKAREQGKIRYIGFTGHTSPHLMLKMLARDYDWDAVQMPLNPLDGTYHSFEKQVLPILVRRQIAVLAMKTRGGGPILRSGACTAEECWRYVAGLPVATIVSGMESLALLRGNLKMAQELEPMNTEEMADLRKRTAEPAATGEHEPYKSV